MTYLYHIAKRQDWEESLTSGEYAIGSLHRSFESDGFIHLAYAHQVNVMADLINSDTTDLLLLTIEPKQLKAHAVEEKVDFPAELFPHLYGILSIDALVGASSYQKPTDGHLPVVGKPREEIISDFERIARSLSI